MNTNARARVTWFVLGTSPVEACSVVGFVPVFLGVPRDDELPLRRVRRPRQLPPAFSAITSPAPVK